MKLDINTWITQVYHSRCSSWKLSSKARMAWDFSTLLSIQKGEKTETMPSEIVFPTSTSGAFLNQTVNKQTSHEKQRILDTAAVFQFPHPVEKLSFKNITSWHKTLSASAVKVILTNQSIKIGRRAWPTRDMVRKVKSIWLPCLHF